jgi:two-component system, NtrC family, nitrogen regulation sensor histidine kinase NtrY
MFNRLAWLFILLVGCLAGCFVSASFYRVYNEEFNLHISRNLQSELLKLRDEAKLIQSSKQLTWSDLHGAHYLIEAGQLKSWSVTDFAPDARMMADTSALQFWQTALGDFIVARQVLRTNQVLISMLPLVRRYPITNRYLPTHLNEAVFEHYQVRVFPPEIYSGEPITMDDQVLLRVSFLSTTGPQLISLIFGVGALILLVLILVHFIRGLHNQRKYARAFLMMSFSFVAMRILMVEFNFPARWWPSNIFNPQEFASSTYNASVGDLVLNSLGILVICAYVFFTYSRWRIIQNLLRSKYKGAKKVIGVLLLIAAFFSFLYPFLFIETIFHNSEIALDITRTLLIDALRGLAFFALLLGTISGFFFTHVFIRVSKALNKNRVSFFLTLAAALFLFVAYFILEGRNYWITVLIAVPYFVVLHLTQLSLMRKRAIVSFLYFFLTLFAFGLQSAFSIKRFSEEEKVESQFRFAASYLIDRDVMAEYLLNESRKRISSDAFIQSRMASPFLSRSAARQKIKQVYLSSYFDRYDLQIHLFTASRDPLDELSINNWSEWNQQITNPQFTTEYEGIYFIRSNSVERGKRYVVVIPVQRAAQLIGYAVLDLSLKRTIPQSVYPELLVDSRFAEYFENRDKSFAVIANGHIQSNFGNFNYERDFTNDLLNDSQLFNDGISKNGFIHTAVEDDAGRMAVVTSRTYPNFFVLTNFSFFFILCVFLIALVLMGYGLYSWIEGKQINYATRIQLYIYLAFALPLVVVASTTLNRVSRSAEVQLTQAYLDKARVLGENLLPALASYVHNPSENRSELDDRLSTAARFADVDVSVFDKQGRIVASSQPAIGEGLISSGLMNRTAWEQIFQKGDIAFVLNDKIGALNFNNAFFALRSPETSDILGAISLPFFESAQSLDATQITVLANILTVFALIFIVFSLLSFYIVESLTFPLRFITRTLRHTTLTGNKQLEWKSNDEIGLMVNEYNKMVDNLEQSKIELSRSQKESAWREMARQVAHEIKNPLTPMKLTLQQMQLWLAKDTLEKERARQAVNTLLNQVEILNEIASSFSAFARMPAPIPERMDLVALLTKTVNLYSTYEGGKVDFKSNELSVFVNGDPQLLDRIFSNLILNGLQADGNPPHVGVELKRDATSVTIIIQDNGAGIPTELQDKIFIPYFTTKKSGSGLGLAIARQGIELSSGKIWFDSKPGKTTFYVELPVI